MLKECADRGDDYDSHWELVPICAKCGAQEIWWEHDKENPDAHDFIAPTEPLVWGENAHRWNECSGSIPNDDPDEYNPGNWIVCNCPCHWSNYYVNIYLADREYGGPEEGGWWYDIGEPIGSIPCDTWKEAWDLREKLKEKYPRTNKRNSVNGGEDYEVAVQSHFAKYYPEVRPHYE